MDCTYFDKWKNVVSNNSTDLIIRLNSRKYVTLGISNMSALVLAFLSQFIQSLKLKPWKLSVIKKKVPTPRVDSRPSRFRPKTNGFRTESSYFKKTSQY